MSFTAEKASPCAYRDCDGIRPGDLIRSTPPDAPAPYAHVECPPAVDPLEVKRGLCPSCFTELPVTGGCGVCE